MRQVSTSRGSGRALSQYPPATAGGTDLLKAAFNLLPVADEYERGPEVRVRELGRRGVAAGNRQAALLAACGLCVRAAQQFDLRAPERLGLRHPFALAAQFVELLHQQTRARVGHGPQRSHHGLRALTLREHAEALDLAPVRACAARRRLAGRARQEGNAADEGR